MSGAWQIALVLAGAAACGTIPFGPLVSRAWGGSDLRGTGSGNIGATNVLRASGPAAGALTLALDAGKGAAAVGIALLLAPATAAPPASWITVGSWAALAAVVGHVFSPWVGFRGGKGVATAIGAMLVLSPPLAATAILIFGTVVAVTRIISAGSVAASIMTPALLLVGPFAGALPFAPIAGMSAIVLVRHAGNLVRLLNGTEPRIARGGEGRARP